MHTYSNGPSFQVFYATIGASANVGLVLRTAPILFFFSLVALGGHLGLLLGIGRLLGFSRRDLLLASNANIGGEAHWGSKVERPTSFTEVLGWKGP